MGARMYVYAIRKDDFWEISDKIHRFFVAYGLSSILLAPLLVMKNVHKKSREEIYEKWKEVHKYIVELPTDEMARYEVRLQLLDFDNEHYIFRVLESGNTFRNCYKSQGWPVIPLFYNSIADEDPSLYPIVLWADEQIEQKRYLLWPALSGDDIRWEVFKFSKELNDGPNNSPKQGNSPAS